MQAVYNSEGDRTVVNDGEMMYVNREFYVRHKTALWSRLEYDPATPYYVCDIAGIADGEDLEHIGDGFMTLEEAIVGCDEAVEWYYRD